MWSKLGYNMNSNEELENALLEELGKCTLEQCAFEIGKGGCCFTMSFGSGKMTINRPEIGCRVYHVENGKYLGTITRMSKPERGGTFFETSNDYHTVRIFHLDGGIFRFEKGELD